MKENESTLTGRADLDSLAVDELQTASIEDESDTLGGVDDVERLGFWGYLQFLKSLDASDRRLIFDLQFDILALKFSNFCHKCRNMYLEAYIFRLEIRHGLRRFPRFHLQESPNVELTGADRRPVE